MVELENGHKKILTKNAKERNAVARQLLSSSVAKESFRGKLTQGKKVNSLCFKYLIKICCMAFGNHVEQAYILIFPPAESVFVFLRVLFCKCFSFFIIIIV